MQRGTTLLACRTDAPTALDTAYDMYAVGLYDYCRWALGDDKLASDAVGDTLLAAVGRGLIPVDGGPTRPEPRLRSAPRRTDTEPLRAWIFTVARAECAARAAALPSAPTTRGRTTTAGRPAHDHMPCPAPSSPVVDGGGSRYRDRNFPIPQLTLHEQWQLAQLRQGLDELTPAAQEVAELAFRHGFSAPALAAILGRPLRAVRSAVADAYAHLSSSCADGVAVAFAVPPFAPLPPALRRLVLEAAAVPSRPRHLAERHAPYARDGFPGRGRRRLTGWLALAAAAVAALAAVAAAPVPDVASRSVATDASTAQEELDLPHPDAAGPDYAVAPSPAAPVTKPALKPSAVTRSPRSRPAAQPAAAPVLRRGMSTRMEFSYDLATKTWAARITATVHGFVPAEVRIAVWWRDSTGTHRRRSTATRVGADAYAAEFRGLADDPQACAQAVAVSASGEMLMGPVTGQLCG